MRVAHLLFYGGVVIMLGFLVIACNDIVGFDPEMKSDAAVDAVVDCRINRDFPLIASYAKTSSLTHVDYGSGTVPQLEFDLTYFDAEQDRLRVKLISSALSMPTIMPGTVYTYPISEADTHNEKCALCIYVDVDYDPVTGVSLMTLMPEFQGDLQFTVANSTQYAGSLHFLKFHHVQFEGNDQHSVPVDDGCIVTIEDVEFDMTYTAVVP